MDPRDGALRLPGAALGAPARYLVDRAVQARWDTVLPSGTIAVNVGGSLMLGALTGLAVHRQVPTEVMLCLGTGFCGALTTYSTFSYESLRLWEAGRIWSSLTNVALSLTGGLCAAVLGYAVGSVFGRAL